MKAYMSLLGLAAIIIAAECFDFSDMDLMLDPSAQVEFQERIGDITFLKDRDPRQKRGAVVNDAFLWPGGVVKYNLTNFFTEQERVTILSAMRHWEDHTCIRFVPVTNRFEHHITLYPGVGCSSYVGRIRANQGISLGRSCFAFHTIVHELGHAIGFYHEQSRPDRDEHVEIIYENIVQGAESQFARLQEHHVETGGVGYDYNSIMHYDRNLFSRDFISDTIVARDPNIPVGGAVELSEFDKVETNRLYHCDTITPGPKTVVPQLPQPIFPPQPYPCGGALQGERGTFSSPVHDEPMECAWMIRAPIGYHVRVIFEPLLIPNSPGCSSDFVEVFDTIDGSDRGLGNICGNWRRYTLGTIDNVAFVHFSSRGQAQFDATFDIIDKNECNLGYCSHGCVNFPGGYECTCPTGFFLSADGKQCFDVNECALNAAECDHNCVNTGGSYYCECRDGFVLQPDGKTCLPPGAQLQPEPIIIATQPTTATTQPTTRPTTATTQPTTRPTTATTQPTTRPTTATTQPTTRPTTATTPPTTQAPTCGGRLTAASGSVLSPNWPETYNVNEICEWTIELADDTSRIVITFEDQNFGIAGSMPSCSKDVLEIFDGLSSNAVRICGIVIPEVITTTSNTARIVFTAGPTHGANRNKGFKLGYNTVFAQTAQQAPTTIPITTVTTQPATTTPTTEATTPTTEATTPTTEATTPTTEATTPTTEATTPTTEATTPTTEATTPTTEATTEPPTQIVTGCGGRITAAGGSILSSNWPETYNVNEECEWVIELPDATSRIRITFDDEEFGIAGRAPSCRKDVLIIYDGLDSDAESFSRICGTILPQPIITTSNTARIVFTAGPSHGPLRKGFKLDFERVAPAVITITQTNPECDNLVTMEENGIIKSPNWPATYPMNLRCEWLLTVSDSSKVLKISFDDRFALADRTDNRCQRDALTVYNGHESNTPSHGPYCAFTVPSSITTSTHQARIVFEAGPFHGPLRIGFQATAECI